MSRVFRLDELQNRKLPKLGDFPPFVALLRKTIGRATCVVAALVYGPVLRGDWTTRSTVNVLIVRRIDGERETQKLVETLEEMASRRHIPLLVTVYDIDSALNGRHHLGPMTLDYLRLATTQGGLIKDDPLAIFKPLPMAPRWELEYYLARKREYFEQSVQSYDDMSEDERVMALGQALEFPFGVASRMLQYSKPFAWQSVGAMRGPVVMLYPSLVSNRVQEIFGTLLSFNISYDGFLGVHRKHPNRNYIASLDILRVAIMLAPEFAEMNLALLDTLE